MRGSLPFSTPRTHGEVLTAYDDRVERIANVVRAVDRMLCMLGVPVASPDRRLIGREWLPTGRPA